MNLVVNGLLLNYSESGQPGAPVVLMLHGWGADSRSLDALAAALSPHYRVVQLDLPGFGGSEVPPADWHVTDFAQTVHDFAAKAKLPKLHAIIGHSFGGRVAITAIGGHLLRPSRLVLIGAPAIARTGSARNQFYKAAAKTGKVVTALPGLSRLRSGLRRRLYQSAGSTDYLDAGPLREIFLNTISDDLRQTAAKIKTPALLIWGDNDTDAPLADARALAVAIRGSRLEIIPGAGHYVFLDAPGPVAQYIKDFLG
jgi:pimeloyl-ACP methyl ester carboxylesterase